MFIELPTIISVKQEDPRTIVGLYIITDELLIEAFYGTTQDYKAEEDKEVLITENALYNLYDITRVGPSPSSDACYIYTRYGETLIPLQYDVILKKIKEVGINFR